MATVTVACRMEVDEYIALIKLLERADYQDRRGRRNVSQFVLDAVRAEATAMRSELDDGNREGVDLSKGVQKNLYEGRGL